MAITNLTAEEMRGSGSLGPTLANNVTITATNTLNSNGQYPTSYLTLESNATSNQNLTTSTNIGEHYWFSPNTNNFAAGNYFAERPFGKNSISIPFRTQPNGSPIQEGVLIAVTVPHAFSGNLKTLNLISVAEGDIAVIDTSEGLIHAGDTVTCDVAANGLSYFTEGGIDITDTLPLDTVMVIQYDSNSIITSITLNYTGTLPVALGNRFEVNAITDPTLVGTGFRIISPNVFARPLVGTTFSDPYYIKSTGNISIKLEDI